MVIGTTHTYCTHCRDSKDAPLYTRTDATSSSSSSNNTLEQHVEFKESDQKVMVKRDMEHRQGAHLPL